jgi:DNA-directed RNA polymerase subunit beta'
MATRLPKIQHKDADPDSEDFKVGGPAFHALLSAVNVKAQFEGLKAEIPTVSSPSRKDDMIKRLKYLQGIQKAGLKPQEAYIINNMPVLPPIFRPVSSTGNNKIEYSDVNFLYKEHMLVNEASKEPLKELGPSQLIMERKSLYDGAKAIFGLGESINSGSRAVGKKGIIRQIAGNTGPKQGFFHSKLLSKKQDFSGRSTIYAEPNLGFNEAAIPVDMLWSMYEYHTIRDLVKSGFNYVEAKKAVVARNPTAQASFSKLIKHIPVILNRAPTLMASNVTAFYPIPIKGKTIGMNPMHLPFMAADYDGDALSVFVPMSPEAIHEAKTKLLPMQHIHDTRKGLGNSMVAPGHEAVIGSVYMTEPDHEQKAVEFKNEAEVMAALKAGTIKENTPIILKT